MVKKIGCFVLAGVLAVCCMLSGCQKDTPLEAVQSTDKYRNFYEIFVYSFNDSDGDGVGDINGVIEKLDYLNDGDPNGGDDLGIDGIWFMPINKSVSYHKYSVEDYMSIDENYGTMEDFDRLLAECDKRGIAVIMDLVVNHSSNKHPWFVQAVEEVKQGNFDGYAKYYHFVDKKSQGSASGYNPVPDTDLLYESNFDVAMPELNLNEPKVREEIKEIMKFWLDKGVSGFRLDAVKYFDSGGDNGSDFLTWMDKAAKEIKKDAYLVGEEWAGKSEIADYYDTGIDSLFNFPMSGADGIFETTVRMEDTERLMNALLQWQNTIRKHNKNAIDAPFLSNHDTVRSGIALGQDLVKQKTAAMLYLFAPGNPFIYYGEELGMVGNNGNDSSYRIPMPWQGGEAENIVIPGMSVNDAIEASPTTAKEALADDNSLFRFYQKLLKMKLQNPEIARGTITKVVTTESASTAGMVIEYEGKSVMVVYHLGSEEVTAEISKDNMDYSKIVGQATAQDANDKGEYPQAVLKGTTLTIPSKGIVILK